MPKNKMPNFFINAFYERKFKDNLFVVKASGKVVEDDRALTSLLENIRDLTMHGIKVLLIYGGGKILDEAAAARGLEVEKHNGRRITDKATIALMKEIIGGTLTLRVHEAMTKTHCHGLSLNCAPEDWMRVTLRPAKDGKDFGFVGDIHAVYNRPINRLLKVTSFIACPSLAITTDGVTCNINADTIATELAIGTKAHKLIFLSDVDGVQINNETAFMITAEDIPALIENGTVTDGMRVKMENCARALNGGVRRIHLISGLRRNALKSEIYEPVGPGTMLIRESERQSYMNEVEAQKVLEAQK